MTKTGLCKNCINVCHKSHEISISSYTSKKSINSKKNFFN